MTAALLACEVMPCQEPAGEPLLRWSPLFPFAAGHSELMEEARCLLVPGPRLCLGPSCAWAPVVPGSLACNGATNLPLLQLLQVDSERQQQCGAVEEMQQRQGAELGRLSKRLSKVERGQGTQCTAVNMFTVRKGWAAGGPLAHNRGQGGGRFTSLAGAVQPRSGWSPLCHTSGQLRERGNNHGKQGIRWQPALLLERANSRIDV